MRSRRERISARARCAPCIAPQRPSGGRRGSDGGAVARDRAIEAPAGNLDLPSCTLRVKFALCILTRVAPSTIICYQPNLGQGRALMQRGRSPNMRSSSLSIVRRRSRGSLPRLRLNGGAIAIVGRSPRGRQTSARQFIRCRGHCRATFVLIRSCDRTQRAGSCKRAAGRAPTFCNDRYCTIARTNRPRRGLFQPPQRLRRYQN